jgi:hypothetical protein
MYKTNRTRSESLCSTTPLAASEFKSAQNKFKVNMRPKTPFLDPALLVLQQQMLFDAAEQQAARALQTRRRSSLRSADLGVDDDIESPVQAEKSPLKFDQSLKRRRSSARVSPRNVSFAKEELGPTNSLAGENVVFKKVRRKSSISQESIQTTTRRESLRSSSSGPKSPKQVSSNGHSKQAPAPNPPHPPNPKLRNPYPNKRRASLRGYIHRPTHYQHSIPKLPHPKPFVHRCGRKDCTARFRSRNKMHTHIREVHGHKPLE